MHASSSPGDHARAWPLLDCRHRDGQGQNRLPFPNRPCLAPWCRGHATNRSGWPQSFIGATGARGSAATPCLVGHQVSQALSRSVW